MKTKAVSVNVQPRFRVMRRGEIALGPGKADLLEQVGKTGSIAEAAEKMGMSYMRAWSLLKTMERCFAQPLIRVSRGGAQHGGARLTAHGLKALGLYREMEAKSLGATAGVRRRMAGLLRD